MVDQEAIIKVDLEKAAAMIAADPEEEVEWAEWAVVEMIKADQAKEVADQAKEAADQAKEVAMIMAD